MRELPKEMVSCVIYYLNFDYSNYNNYVELRATS